MEIQAADTLCGKIQRCTQSLEIGEAARSTVVARRRRAHGSQGRYGVMGQSLAPFATGNRTVERAILIPVRLWHKNGAVPSSRSTRRSRPLDPSSLNALALHYVGRFATTQARLGDYLKRKVAERGWVDEGPAPIADIVARCVAAGYVDDVAFAEAKSRSLARRGYGHRRVEVALNKSGIARSTTESLRPDADAAYQSAENFARNRRIGRFAPDVGDAAMHRRQFAAMIRAGHSPQLAGYFVRGVPDEDNEDIN